MLSEKFECIFVHVPKTGGQSIESVFLDLHGLTWEGRAPLLLRTNPDPEKGPERLAHLTATEYLDRGYVSKAEFSSNFRFAFVRNPWERLLSEYRYRGYQKRFSFRDFVTSNFPTASSYADEYRHVMPQAEFLTCEDGELVVDFVGRFESLQADFDAVCSRLGLAPVRLPTRNASLPGQPGYGEAFDDEMVEIVRDRYARDISLFGYEFERP